TSEANSHTAMPGTKAPRTSTSANIRGLPQQQRCLEQARAEDLAPGERRGERLAFPRVLRAAGKSECPLALGTCVPGGLDDAPARRMKKARRGICQQA